MRALVTGAAGFIGSAVSHALEERGHDVVRVDAYISQSHPRGALPARGGGTVRADVTDAAALIPLLDRVDVVCHQAAMVGAGVSAADLPRFARNNDLGTATLLAAMAEAGVGALLLASSMVVYGDGRYLCPRHGEQRPAARRIQDLQAGRFDMRCPIGHEAVDWVEVDESAALEPRSGYAASKVAQEHYAGAWARQTGGRVVALRYHNVYGPQMPRNSPYSGVAALFKSALAQDERPRVFEDGRQMRDFVHVGDVAAANVAAVEYLVDGAPDTFDAFNVCSGTPISIADVARLVAEGRPLEPIVTGEFRPGDVRHVVASPERARGVLGFTARVEPQAGLEGLATEPLRDV